MPAAERVANLYAAGRSAHPELDLDFGTFARLFSAAGAEQQPAQQALTAADLYLAYACGAGVSGAVAKFEALYGSSIERAVARVLSQAKDREEAAQRARQILLVGEPPKIARFRGHGPLAGWVSVVALRVAVSTGRAETAERRLRQKLIASAIGEADPERQLIERETRAKVEHALTEALNKLESRDRLVLRLHLVSGMSLTAIAKVFRVNHTTVSRRMRRVCDELLDAVAAALRDGSDHPRDLSSLMSLLASRLEISVSRLLAPE